MRQQILTCQIDPVMHIAKLHQSSDVFHTVKFTQEMYLVRPGRVSAHHHIAGHAGRPALNYQIAFGSFADKIVVNQVVTARFQKRDG